MIDISESEKQIETIFKESEKLINKLMGEIMKSSGGQADPKIVKEILVEKLFQELTEKTNGSE